MGKKEGINIKKIIGEGEVSFGFLLKRNREKREIDFRTASIEEIKAWMDRQLPEMFPQERRDEIIRKIEELRRKKKQT